MLDNISQRVKKLLLSTVKVQVKNINSGVSSFYSASSRVEKMTTIGPFGEITKMKMVKWQGKRMCHSPKRWHLWKKRHLIQMLICANVMCLYCWCIMLHLRLRYLFQKLTEMGRGCVNGRICSPMESQFRAQTLHVNEWALICQCRLIAQFFLYTPSTAMSELKNTNTT